LRLLRIIVEGQLALAGIVAIFAIELAFLFWGLWSRRPIIGLVAVFLTVPLMRSTLGAIRACFCRIRPPEGLHLDHTEGDALYGLVDDVRRQTGAPRVDEIIVTRRMNAAALAYFPARRLRRRRALIVGLPVLATLSAAELRAVIAHELAHFSSASDPFAAWVYRTRNSWLALRSALDQRLATPIYVYWFLRWYLPRLNTASAEVARRHEFVADQVAARAAGSRAAADALVVFEAAERFAEDTYWPAIQTSHQMAAEPPRPYTGMLTWNVRIPSPELLEDIFAAETASDDTHPSLRERFERLGEAIRVPPAAVSAGEEILGRTLEKLAQQFDRQWLSENGESWHRLHAEYSEQTRRLERLSRLESPTPDEMFQRAELLETLERPDEALPIHERAAQLGHPGASLAAGRLLLDCRNAHGVPLVEAAIAADENLVQEGCRVLARYYKETRQELTARQWEWHATRHATRAHLSARTG
jgi:Zn-dependent protease with chaperone function